MADLYAYDLIDPAEVRLLYFLHEARASDVFGQITAPSDLNRQSLGSRRGDEMQRQHAGFFTEQSGDVEVTLRKEEDHP